MGILKMLVKAAHAADRARMRRFRQEQLAESKRQKSLKKIQREVEKGLKSATRKNETNRDSAEIAPRLGRAQNKVRLLEKYRTVTVKLELLPFD